MSKRLARVRAMVASHEAGRGRRYPTAVQDEVVRYARERRSEGASWSVIADEVGVWFETLRRWCTAEAPPPTMVEVEVVDDRPPPSSVVIVSPSGYRLEGLDAASAVAALRALR